jgi:hypothetical protein
MNKMNKQNCNQANNFQRNWKVQVFCNNEWVDYTKPCGSKVVVNLAVVAMAIYDADKVRIEKIN